MGTFEIAVFTSEKLYNHCDDDFGNGFEARDMAIEFIEGAFERSSDHSVVVEPADQTINAPQESINSSFESTVPCSSETGTWADLWDWWKYWLNKADCNDPHTYEKDCNLLLTDADGGGLGGGRIACSGGGYVVADNYDSYKDYGFEEEFGKAETILEEVGHCLVKDMEDEDYGDDDGDGQLAHDSGDLFYHDPINGKSGYTITPIGVTGDEEYNNCGEKVDKDENWNESGWEARYSSCTEEYFEEKGEV